MFLLIPLKNLVGKNRNNLSDDYTCLGLSLEKLQWGKHEIRHMLASNIVSLKTLYEKNLMVKPRIKEKSAM